VWICVAEENKKALEALCVDCLVVLLIFDVFFPFLGWRLLVLIFWCGGSESFVAFSLSSLQVLWAVSPTDIMTKVCCSFVSPFVFRPQHLPFLFFLALFATMRKKNMVFDRTVFCHLLSCLVVFLELLFFRSLFLTTIFLFVCFSLVLFPSGLCYSAFFDAPRKTLALLLSWPIPRREIKFFFALLFHWRE